MAQEEVKQRFPVIEAGNYFEYGVNQQANTSAALNTTRICGVTIRTASWRYEIVNVTEEVIVIKVSWKAYLNGTYQESGGYTVIVHWRNLLFFKVFFDVTRIYEAITRFLSIISPSGDYSENKEVSQIRELKVFKNLPPTCFCPINPRNPISRSPSCLETKKPAENHHQQCIDAWKQHFDNWERFVTLPHFLPEFYRKASPFRQN